MRTDKEWLKNEIGNLKGFRLSPMTPKTLDEDKVIALVNMLDEPEKVVIPEWFADFIEEKLESTSDGDLVMDLWVIYYHGDFPVKHFNWLRNNKELATRAILDGYTVEQPKLLTVIVKSFDKTIMTKQMPEDEVNKMMEGLE